MGDNNYALSRARANMNEVPNVMDILKIPGTKISFKNKGYITLASSKVLQYHLKDEIEESEFSKEEVLLLLHQIGV